MTKLEHAEIAETKLQEGGRRAGGGCQHRAGTCHGSSEDAQRLLPTSPPMGGRAHVTPCRQPRKGRIPAPSFGAQKSPPGFGDVAPPSMAAIYPVPHAPLLVIVGQTGAPHTVAGPPGPSTLRLCTCHAFKEQLAARVRATCAVPQWHGHGPSRAVTLQEGTRDGCVSDGGQPRPPSPTCRSAS